MKILIRALGIVALTLAASSAAFADVHINVGINPFGWGAPPPVVYAPPRYYGPPPVVYYGRGHWGDRRDGRGHDRGRSDHQDRGGGRR
ncbi:MAG: putative transrane protein [Gammaproteobacteria bacterium]|nr:putative transrane protein [Gammaproteobacteria bacterium]